MPTDQPTPDLDAVNLAKMMAGAFELRAKHGITDDAPPNEEMAQLLRALLAALATLREDLANANAHIALLEGEAHTGCREAEYQLQREVATLTAEVAALREDKARLDWLEANFGRAGGSSVDEPKWMVWGEDDDLPTFEGATLREAVDAARASQPGGA